MKKLSLIILLILSTGCLFSQKVIKGGRIDNTPIGTVPPTRTVTNSLSPNGFLLLLIIPAAFVLYKLFNKKESNVRYSMPQNQPVFEDTEVASKKVSNNINIVNKNEAIDALKKIKIPFNSDHTGGYTEKYVQRELEKGLKESFNDVSREYSLQGKRGTKVDIDLGDGQLGIEVKLLRGVYGSSESNRLSGQIDKYKKAYGDNVLVCLVGEKELKEDSMYKEVLKEIKEKGVESVYVEVLARSSNK